MARKDIESIINTENIENAEAIVLSAPYGRSFTYRSGAEKGPEEIVNCLHGNLEFFDRFLYKEPFRSIKIGHHRLENLNDLSPEEMVQVISEFNFKNKDKFILTLGGDHSVSIGSFHFLSQHEQPSDITIFQIDAHPDLRDNTLDYQETSNKYSHACTMRSFKQERFLLKVFA